MIQSELLEANSAKQAETTKSLAETAKRNVASVFLAWLECNRGGGWSVVQSVFWGEGDGDLSLSFPCGSVILCFNENSCRCQTAISSVSTLTELGSGREAVSGAFHKSTSTWVCGGGNPNAQLPYFQARLHGSSPGITHETEYIHSVVGWKGSVQANCSECSVECDACPC